jgi:tRNA(fMet)-specific endonuclease VapC
MLFLLDTNAVSDIVREQPGIVTRVRTLAAGSDVATCTIVRGELLFGVERLPVGNRRDELRQKVGAVLAALRCEPVVESAGEHYARTKRVCQVNGLPLDENDLWIAATALAAGAVLVTRDGHFSRRGAGRRRLDGVTLLRPLSRGGEPGLPALVLPLT